MGSDRQSNTVRCGHLPYVIHPRVPGLCPFPKAPRLYQLPTRVSISLCSFNSYRFPRNPTGCNPGNLLHDNAYPIFDHPAFNPCGNHTFQTYVPSLFFCVFLSQDWNRECPPTFGKFKSTTPALPVYDRIVLSGSFANGRECSQWGSSRTF